MWNIPSKERLEKIPKLYETESIPLEDKMIHLHFFIGGCDCTSPSMTAWISSGDSPSSTMTFRTLSGGIFLFGTERNQAQGLAGYRL